MWPLFLLLAGSAVYALWWNGRLAAQVATALGRAACRQAGVQWLDQNVHLVGLRLRRRQDGWLGLERRYRFDYSFAGDDRHSGELVLLGGQLVGLLGPQPALPADPTRQLT
jgi:hypothetical protein